MESVSTEGPPEPAVTHPHHNCLAEILLLLGDNHELDRLADLLHYTTIAEREYAQICRLRHL